MDPLSLSPLPVSGRSSSSPLQILELWHGPTLAFKDVALQLVGKLLGYFVARRKQRLNILVGTSGDTGSAAIEAVRGLPGVSLCSLTVRAESAWLSLSGEHLCAVPAGAHQPRARAADDHHH